ncbi:MAG: DUF4268 domain-containing protein [Sedimentisphaerales bacterium]|nr:DUF4268 domain-containing protein [Sedimentisphaerales bacterium]
MIGKIERLPLREVWKHEALDFTTWLQENIEVLNETLDTNLSNAERERTAGSFSVDLVAEDDKGNPVIIENQLEKSNHDHLGKLVTYLTAIGAKTAIWIVADPRPEHVNAISWLNESSSASFYLMKLEAIRIGDSKPAPLLTLIVGPSEEAIDVGKTKQEMAERYDIRKRFWTNLLELAKTKTKLHATISPSEYSWIGVGAGLRGLGLNYTVTKHASVVELYIDRGKESDEENLQLFQQLYGHKEEIEKSFGEPLEWQPLEGRRACRIRKLFELGGYRDEEEKWPQIHEAMVDAMIRFEKALRPYIKVIKI